MNREWIKMVPERWKSRKHYVDFQYKFAPDLFSFYRRYIDFKNKKILEIGCGMGGFSVFLAQKGARVVGVDSELYNKILNTAKKFAKLKGVKVDFKVVNAQELKFVDESFDALVMNSVVEHLEKPFKVLSECKRVLKPEGMLFVNFPLFYGPFGGHIDDFIKIPWYHLLPHRMVKQKLTNKKLKKGLLTGENVMKVYNTLNRITIFNFKNYIKRLGLIVVAYKISPSMNTEGVRYLRSVQNILRKKSLRKALKTIFNLGDFFNLYSFVNFMILLTFLPLAYLPYINEFFAGAVTMVIEKPAKRFKKLT